MTSFCCSLPIVCRSFLVASRLAVARTLVTGDLVAVDFFCARPNVASLSGAFSNHTRSCVVRADTKAFVDAISCSSACAAAVAAAFAVADAVALAILVCRTVRAWATV